MTDETTTGFTDPKVAWVTILTHDSYIMGVRVLCRSLQNTGTRFPLVVLYTDNISPSLIKILQKDGAKVKQLNIKHFPACLANQPGKIPVHNDICAKLCVWELTEYERVCFLDADVLVVRNMDELFEFNINADAGFSIGAVNKCSCTAEYADAMSVER
jgi:alpha-N-acetylglucosamine transferase